MPQHILLAAGLAAGIVSASAPAQAADDGYDNVFSSVLTAVGVMPPSRTPEIEYRERSPLVVPPKTALAAPVPVGSARPASWPNDPDIARRKKADEEARAPMEDLFARSRDGVISKGEMARGRTDAAPARVPGDCDGFANNNRSCNLVSPDQLKADGEKFEAALGGQKEVITAGVEPERVYLTQPPKGYMKATKTVKATREAPQIAIDESNPKAANYYKPPAEEQ